MSDTCIIHASRRTMIRVMSGSNPERRQVTLAAALLSLGQFISDS